jgi:hypothetical protein
MLSRILRANSAGTYVFSILLLRASSIGLSKARIWSRSACILAVGSALPGRKRLEKQAVRSSSHHHGLRIDHGADARHGVRLAH